MKRLISNIGLILFTLNIPFLLFLSCSKDEIYINISPNPEDTLDPDSTGTNKANVVDFTAMIESVSGVMSKSVSTMSAGHYLAVYAYVSGTSGSNGLTNFINYKVGKAGSLIPIQNPMQLPPGNYDFYAVSSNTSINITPMFSNMQGSGLSNGVDYLWWTKKNVPIYNSDMVIPITFTHSCTQLSINIVAGNENIYINSFNSAQVTPPITKTSTWSLNTGQITPLSQLNSQMISMTVHSKQANQILLPIVSADTLTTILNVNVDNETIARNYSVKILAPPTGFLSGRRYVYNVALLPDTITFSTVHVQNWVEVNETGTPLYPTND